MQIVTDRPLMSHRIAFIDYFPIHYRRGLYEALARRMDVDFYFFSDERERWHNPAIAATTGGDYHRVDIRHYRIGNQAVAPGIVRCLWRRRYDAVVKSPNGRSCCRSRTVRLAHVARRSCCGQGCGITQPPSTIG